MPARGWLRPINLITAHTSAYGCDTREVSQMSQTSQRDYTLFFLCHNKLNAGGPLGGIGYNSRSAVNHYRCVQGVLGCTTAFFLDVPLKTGLYKKKVGTGLGASPGGPVLGDDWMGGVGLDVRLRSSDGV
jgi:hypothetical protein